jgi:hypothetical protein
MRFLFTAIVLLFLGLSPQSPAQTSSENQGEPEAFAEIPQGRFFLMEFGLQLNFPKGPYKRQNNHTAVGIGGNISLPLKDIPVYAGLDMNYNIFQYTKTSEPWDNEYYYGFYDTETLYQVASFHLLGRIQPEYGPALPYIDLLFGFNVLWTHSSIDLDDYYEDDSDLSSHTVTTDAALSGGIGIGIMLKLTDMDKDSETDNGLYLNTGIRMMFGGEAKYATTEGKEIRNDEVIYEIKESKTDMYILRLGIVLKI